MNPHDDAVETTGAPARLRREAEARLQAQGVEHPAGSEEDARRLLHELRVHQIELEMQNDELRQTQTLLEESREKYFGLFDLAPAGYLILNEQGLIQKANLTVATLLGVERKALLKQPLSRFILPTDQDSYYRHRKNIFETGAPQVCELRLPRANANPRWVSMASNLDKDEDGGQMVRSIITDISTRKEAEQRYHDLFHQANQGLLLMALDGQLCEVNRAFAAMHGYAMEELGGKNPKNLDVFQERTLADRRDIIRRVQAGETVHFEAEHLHKDGHSIPFRVSVSLITLDGRMFFLASYEDISGQRQAAITLQASEEMLRNIFVSTADAITVVDVSGQITLCNQATADIHGFSSPAQLLGKSFIELVAEADRPRATAGMSQVARLGCLRDIPFIGLKGANKTFSGELTVSVLKDRSGQPVGFVGITKDVTERKRAEAVQQASEAKFRTLVENIPAKIFLKDRDLNFLAINEYFARDLGISSAAVVGKTDFDFFPKELADKYRADDQRIMESGQTEELEEKYIKADRETWVQVIKSPVRNAQGAITGVLGIFYDITDHKQAEMALQKSEAKYRWLFDNAEVGMFRTRLDGSEFLDVNAKYLAILGRTREEVIGKATNHFWADQREREEMVKTLKATAHVNNLECHLRKKDGSVITCIMSLRLYPEQGILEGSTIDITERKQREEEVRTILQTTIEGFYLVDMAGRILSVNDAYCAMIGYSQAELLTMGVRDVEELDTQAVIEARLQQIRESGSVRFETKHRCKDGSVIDIEAGVTLLTGEQPRFVCFMHNITERKRKEAQKDVRRKVIESLHKSGELADVCQRSLGLLKTWVGCDAAGLRLQAEEDFPFVAQEGFASDFLLKENTLLTRTADGVVQRGPDGKARLECTCGLVLSGNLDPALPFSTPGGSFWINDTAPLLELTPEQDPRHHPRNTCIHEGYASIALVPVRNKERIVGLLQFNGRRRGLFNHEMIAFLEDMATHLGEILQRKQAEAEVLYKSALLEAQLNYTLDGIQIVDNTGTKLIQNQRCTELLRIPKQIVDYHDNLEFVKSRTKNPENFIERVTYLNSHPDAIGRDEVEFRDGMVMDRYSGPVKWDDGTHFGRIWIFRDITESKRITKALEHSNAELRKLTDRLQTIREEERAALARELHDNVGQSLTALQIDLMWLDSRMQALPDPKPAALHDKVVGMIPLVEKLTELTLSICTDLRSSILDDLGLVEALGWLSEEFERRTGLKCALTRPEGDLALNPKLALALFRIAQQALDNVTRHAQATRSELKIRATVQFLELEVQDNGRGFDLGAGKKAEKILGLVGMRERARLFGGNLNIRSAPGQGTTVLVRIPRAQEER